MAIPSVSEMGTAMSDARAIKATFSTWRPVNGRKVLQLVFEVPIEQQGEVLTMLGAPDDKWCAIAVLNVKPIENDEENIADGVPKPAMIKAAKMHAEMAKPKKRFEDYPLSQQCAMRCEDEEFHGFLENRHPPYWFLQTAQPVAQRAAAAVREMLGVGSRSELGANGLAADRWRELEAEYQTYMTDQKYAEARR